MEIYITEAKMGSVAGFVKGYVVYEGLKLRFKGVAFGRYGGHNVSITFLPSSVKTLNERGIDVQSLIQDIQENIVRGNFTTSEKASFTEPLS
ncbi:MAG: hypothetical protein QXV32_04950 [Conexivisphaerales archaeon]